MTKGVLKWIKLFERKEMKVIINRKIVGLFEYYEFLIVKSQIHFILQILMWFKIEND